MFASRLSAPVQPARARSDCRLLGAAVVGGPDTVREGLQHLAAATGADELLLVCDVFDTPKRLRSLDIAAQAVRCQAGAGLELVEVTA